DSACARRGAAAVLQSTSAGFAGPPGGQGAALATLRACAAGRSAFFRPPTGAFRAPRWPTRCVDHPTFVLRRAVGAFPAASRGFRAPRWPTRCVDHPTFVLRRAVGAFPVANRGFQAPPRWPTRCVDQPTFVLRRAVGVFPAADR